MGISTTFTTQKVSAMRASKKVFIEGLAGVNKPFLNPAISCIGSVFFQEALVGMLVTQ